MTDKIAQDTKVKRGGGGASGGESSERAINGGKERVFKYDRLQQTSEIVRRDLSRLEKFRSFSGIRHLANLRPPFPRGLFSAFSR